MACPESSTSIFRRTPGKETEETRCQPRSVGMNGTGRLFNFAQTASSFRLTVNGAPRPSCRLLRQSVRQTSHAEFRGVSDAEEGQLR